ncbi:MAG: SHOCT domain-containing protein [Raineya sp.]|jgi:TM2 domain-containing membrane protein YozV|nr:SHOCT domain-containing protein [Raineya sp.]
MKSRLAAAFLALVAGNFGVHHFYLGNSSRGFLFLALSITVVPTRIISFFEAIKLFRMSDAEFNLKYNTDYHKQQLLGEFGKGIFSGGATQKLDVADELTKLASLMDKGLITFEEFEKRKATLLK